jgi:hypothetical protein
MSIAQHYLDTLEWIPHALDWNHHALL